MWGDGPALLSVCERLGGNLRDSGFAMRKILRTRGPEPIRHLEFVLRNGFFHSPRAFVAPLRHPRVGSSEGGFPLGRPLSPLKTPLARGPACLEASARDEAPSGQVRPSNPARDRGRLMRPGGSRTISPPSVSPSVISTRSEVTLPSLTWRRSRWWPAATKQLLLPCSERMASYGTASTSSRAGMM